MGLKGLEPNHFYTLTPLREPIMERRRWPVVWGRVGECWGKLSCVQIFRNIFFINTAGKCIVLLHSV